MKTLMISLMAGAMSLAAFQAIAADKVTVQLKWVTGSELTTIGFNVFRSGMVDGKYKKLNGELIPAKHPGELTGDTYKFSNKKIKSGKTYFYKLEIVKSDGTGEWSEIDKVEVK